MVAIAQFAVLLLLAAIPALLAAAIAGRAVPAAAGAKARLAAEARGHTRHPVGAARHGRGGDPIAVP